MGSDDEECPLNDPAWEIATELALAAAGVHAVL